MALVKFDGLAYISANEQIHTQLIDRIRTGPMTFVKFLKNAIAPSANEQLAKLDAHLLADIGVSTAYARTNCIHMPADLGIRLV